jgi:F-type H+-transporting ATPase subunit b
MHKNTFAKRLLLVLFALTFVMAFSAPLVYAEGETTATAEESGAAEQTNPLTPLGINGGLLIVHTFNFLLVATLLTVLLWRPAVNMLDARAAKIQKGLEDAAAAAKARQNAEVDASKVLTDARAEANKLIEEARLRADEVAKGIQTDARSAADKIKSDAQTETVTARNAELASLRDRVVDISVAMAGRILGENIDAKKQSSLVSDFFSNVPDAAKKLGGKVEVVSAMPLNDAEQAKAKSAIGADDITFSVDPSILGGVVVRSADKVIDGSVKSGLGNLVGRLG